MNASGKGAKSFLKQNPGIALEIEDKIRGANGLDFGAVNAKDVIDE
jgi:recombination protein RecA